MPRLITVYRDQAVWERETLEVEVPDDLPEDELEAFVREAVEDGRYEEVSEPHILDAAVEGIDTQIEIQN